MTADNRSTDASVTIREIEAQRRRERATLTRAMILCIVFMVVEFVAGFISNSLAITSDALHLMTDVGSYALSIIALVAASRKASHKYSFGWHRAEVLGTLFSVFTIWALAGGICLEAVSRMIDMLSCSGERSCESVDAKVMVTVGFLGILVNISCAAVLYFGGSHGHSHLGGGSCDHHGHSHGEDSHGADDHGHSHGEDSHGADDHGHSHGEEDHGHSHGEEVHGHSHGEEDHGHSHGEENHGHSHGSTAGPRGFAIHAAFLHALGDCVQSLGVIVAGVFILCGNVYSYGESRHQGSLYNLADPFSSIVFALVTLNMTRHLVFDLLAILMESTPSSVDSERLAKALQSIPGVVEVHDLHVWSIASDFTALSVHLVADNHAEVLREAKRVCDAEFRISHHTIQVDPMDHTCGSANGSTCAVVAPLDTAAVDISVRW